MAAPAPDSRAVEASTPIILASRGRARSIWIALVALSALVVYLGTFGHGFVYDDADQIVGNPWIRDPRNIPTILTSGSWDYVGVRSNYYRPVMHLVYMAGYAVFGLWAPGYHLLNVAMHAGATVLVFLLAEHVLGRGGRPRRAVLAPAGVAGLLFATHPIHTEAVAWIGGVPDLCFTLFGLASLHLYATSRADGMPSWSFRYVGSVLAFLLAALSKETALVLPGILVAYDLAFRREDVRPATLLKRQLPFAAVALVYFTLRLNALGSFDPVHRHGHLTLYEVAINVGPLLAGYVAKLVLPLSLSAFHPFTPVTSLLGLRASGSMLVALAAVALGVVLLVRRHQALLAWALTFLPLLPVMYVPALGENPFAERYLYLPSVGFVLALTMAAARAIAAFPRMTPGLLAASAAVLGSYSFATVERNPVWGSDLTLWEDAAAKSPESALVHYNLGAALQANGDRDRAIAAYTRAVDLEPSPLPYNSLGVLYREAGAMGAAMDVLQQALRLDPRYAAAHSNLALVYLDLGMVEPAIAHLRTAVQLAPRQADYLNNLGRALEHAGNLSEARQSYEAALRIDPGHATARRNLAALLGAQQR
jgi:tetratricopeptide (TPR) repeat protein